MIEEKDSNKENQLSIEGKAFRFFVLSLLLHLIMATIFIQHGFHKQVRPLFPPIARLASIPLNQPEKHLTQPSTIIEKKQSHPALTARKSSVLWVDFNPHEVATVTLDDVLKRAKPKDNPVSLASTNQLKKAITKQPAMPKKTSVKIKKPRAQTINAHKKTPQQSDALTAHLEKDGLIEPVKSGTFMAQETATQTSVQTLTEEQVSENIEVRTPQKNILALTKGFIESLGSPHGSGDDFTDSTGNGDKNDASEYLEHALYREKVLASWLTTWNDYVSHNPLVRKFASQYKEIRNAIIKLTINEHGKLISCSLLQPTKHYELDTLIIKTLKLAQLPPFPKHFNKETYTFSEIIMADHLKGNEQYLTITRA